MGERKFLYYVIIISTHLFPFLSSFYSFTPQHLNHQTTIKSTNGIVYPAFLVFVHALRYFRNHALQQLSDQSETAIWPKDVRWVITVPAIWRGPAKQFMREAAHKVAIIMILMFLSFLLFFFAFFVGFL